MPLSIQGNEVLSKMWDSFRISYAEKNPGSNLNDAERYFLYHILHSLHHNSDAFAVCSNELSETEELIEKIR